MALSPYWSQNMEIANFRGEKQSLHNYSTHIFSGMSAMA